MHCQSEQDVIQEQLQSILPSFQGKREELIPILQCVQRTLRYLPELALEIVAQFLGIPLGDVYGVATFYNQFRLTSPGKYQIKVCMGTACHVKGSNIILDEWKRRLDIQEGQTTHERLFGLERVACVGCCALAPVTVVDSDGQDIFYGHMMTSKVNGLIMEFGRQGSDG